MPVVWFIFTSAASIILEVCLGHYGYTIPLTAMTGFYLAVAYTWRKAILCFLVACVLLDLGFGRPFPVSWLMVPYVMLLAQYWRKHGNTKERLLQVLPGLAIGAGAIACVAAYGAMRSFLSETPAEMVSSRMVIQALASSFILLPVLTVFLDSLAKSLGLRRYTSSIHFFFSDDDENDWQEPDE